MLPGGSWITAALGYLAIIATWLNQIFVQQGIPKNGQEWTTLILGNVGGLIGIFAKDFNRSNAPAPTAVAKIIPPEA